jgi:hypothetical protein
MGIFETLLAVNDAVLRPFRQRVDLETITLLLIIALTVAGAWHIVLETVELGTEEFE